MTYNPGIPPTPPPPGAYGAGPYGGQGYAPAPEGPIAHDAPCRKCGYNLRGLSPSMRCPECGTAVGYSLQGDLLRFCDPNWVETLARGAGMIVWGVVVIILGMVAAMLLGMASGPDGATVAAVIGGGAAIIGWIMMTVGWWFLTQPDPSGLGEDRYGTARKIIRVAIVVGVVSQILDMINRAAPMEGSARAGLVVLQVIAGLISVVGFFAQLYYLEKLALRIPDQNLSGRAHFLRFALGISYALLIVLGAIATVSIAGAARGGGAPGGGTAALGCFVGILGLAVLVFMVMYLFLIVGIGRRFKESAQAARSSWAAAPWAPSGARPA